MHAFVVELKQNSVVHMICRPVGCPPPPPHEIMFIVIVFFPGSSNWIIKPAGSASGDYKIAYISGSSQFVTHCRPLDLTPMRNCNVAIVSDVTNAPSCEPDMALKKFCDALIATLKVGGNVLIPCTPTGLSTLLCSFMSCIGVKEISSHSHVNIVIWS